MCLVLQPPLVKSVDLWQYTLIVKLLDKVGYAFWVKEVWLFAEQHVVLRAFYERVKVLWGATEDNAEAWSLYTVTLGMLAHERYGHGAGYIYWPDWTFSHVAEAKARMFSQMRKVVERKDVAPSQVKRDCIWYPRRVATLPVGDGIGQFKYETAPEGEAESARDLVG